MKILAVHPSSLMYSKIYLRLEPLGIELIAAAARRAGHDVQLLDLQAEAAENYRRQLDDWRPDAIAISCNYLANVPEVIDLAKEAAAVVPGAFVFAGGHSASFIARELLDHGDGAIDCVLKGECESSIGPLLEAAASGDRRDLLEVPGVIAPEGSGPPAAISCGIAAGTSSACSTRAHRSSSAGAAPGIARSVAHGPFTDGAIGSRALTPRWPS
jgi:radical SAM superfamily enzyme YgiQ (UPF0313 family)